MIRYLIHQQTAPDHTLGLEKQELAFALAALGQDVALLFSGDGVLQLTSQPPQAVVKDFTQAYKGADLFEIKQIYVDKAAALQHQVLDKFFIPVQLIDDMSAVISQYSVVI